MQEVIAAEQWTRHHQAQTRALTVSLIQNIHDIVYSTESIEYITGNG